MNTRPEIPTGRNANVGSLRKAAVVSRWIGAAASLILTLYAGRHNHSALLIFLFVVWVFSPYFGLIAADRLATRAKTGVAAAIHAESLVLALFPPVTYAAVAILVPGHTTTFAFLAVPGASWLAIATMLVAARLQRRK
jgi:hypothetical protein